MSEAGGGGKKHLHNTTGWVYVRKTKATCECTGGETPGLTVTIHGHMTVQQYALCLCEHCVLGTSLKSSAHKASLVHLRITELHQLHQATVRIIGVKTTLWRSHEAAPFGSAEGSNVNSPLTSLDISLRNTQTSSTKVLKTPDQTQHTVQQRLRWQPELCCIPFSLDIGKSVVGMTSN